MSAAIGVMWSNLTGRTCLLLPAASIGSVGHGIGLTVESPSDGVTVVARRPRGGSGQIPGGECRNQAAMDPKSSPIEREIRLYRPKRKPPQVFCRGCGYPLAGIDQARCPECGRPFDPDEPLTYLTAPGQRLTRAVDRLPRNVIPAGMVLLVFVVGRLLLLVDMGWVLMIPLYPAWILLIVFPSLSMFDKDRFGGFWFWILSGASIGGVAGLLDGLLGSAAGAGFGAIAGTYRAYGDS